LHIDTGLVYRGGQRQVNLLIQNLAEFEIKQYLACPDDSPLTDRLKDSIEKRIPIPKSNFGRLFSRNRLRTFARDNNIDIIHAHDSHAHSLSFALIRKDNRFRIIVSRRSSGRIGLGSKAKYLSDKIYYIAISRHIEKTLIEGGVPRDRIAQIPSMIDLNKFATIEKTGNPAKSDNKKYRIVSACVFDKTKGVYDLVKAVHSLSKNRDDFVYYAYGDGPEMKEISKYVTENKLDDVVKLPGWQSEPVDYLQKADLFVSPSYSEGLNTSVLEAMASGVPVIATSLEPHKENIQHGRSGLLFPPGDIKEMAEQISKILDNPDLIEKIVANAGQVVLKFDCNKVTETIYEQYSRIIALTD
jgi:glycosyltransferase involved in cell wall biosynthesis